MLKGEGRRRGAAWAGLLLAGFIAIPALAQEAPLIEVLPREEHVRQLVLRADLQALRKRYEAAIELYKEALQFAPRRPVILNKLGMAYHLVPDRRNAEKYYKKAVRADKNYAEAWNNLGAVQYGRESYGASIKSYTRAIDLDPVNSITRFNLGTAFFAVNRTDEAIEQFRLALLIDPEVFDRRGRSGKVVQERYVQDRAEFYLTMAKTFAEVGYLSRALQFLRRAMENGLEPKAVEKDAGLSPLRGHPQYQELLRNPPQTIE